LLGTDDLGRDRLSRLLYALRISLVAATAATALTVALGLAVGTVMAVAGRPVQTAVAGAGDVMMSVPWFFLLVIVRAALPLSVSAAQSLLLTFLVLGLLGWPAAARMVAGYLRARREAREVVYARACGMAPRQVFTQVVLPGMVGLLASQAFILVPAYIIAEANLGILGLGITEPMPSVGGMLHALVLGSGEHPALEWTPLFVMLALLAMGQWIWKESGRRWSVGNA
jgi:ABC-type dipeptide/oligopeptide/nickel transport system permease subunit